MRKYINYSYILIILLINMNPIQAIQNEESIAETSTEEKAKEEIEDKNTTTINIIGFYKGSNIEDIYPNANIVDNRVLKESGSSTIYDTLSKVGGINIGTEFEGTIDIRGQGQDRVRRNVQVLLDEMPLNLLGTEHFFPGYNVIPIESVERIEIIPGGGSVLYGSGVQGGVVSLSTGFMTSKEPTKAIYFGVGSFNSKKIAVSFGDNTLISEKLTLQLHYSGETNKSYLRGEYANTDYYSLSSRINLTPEQTIGYAYSYYIEDGKYSGRVSYGKIKKDWRASGTLNDRDRYMEDHKFNYKGKFFGFIEVDDSAFEGSGHWRGKHATDNPDIFTHYIKGNKAKIKTNYNDNGSFLILGNDLLEFKQGIVQLKNRWDYKKTTIGWFGLNKIYWGKLYSTQGYRFNRDFWERHSPSRAIGKNKGARTGFYSLRDSTAKEFSIGYEPKENSSIWVRTETGFTAPEAMRMVDIIKGQYNVNDIKYETFITYEIGAKGNLTSSTYAKIALFYTDTKNEINTVFASPNTHSINIGNTNRQGVELSFNQGVTKYVDLFFNGTYIKGKLKSVNLDNIYALKGIISQKYLDAQIAKWQAKKGGRLVKVPAVNLSTGFSLNFTSNLTLTNTYNYVSNYIPDYDKHHMSVGGRVVSDIDLRYKKDKFNIGIGVNNLFDERYFTLISGLTTARQAMERNYYMDFRYKL